MAEERSQSLIPLEHEVALTATAVGIRPPLHGVRKDSVVSLLDQVEDFAVDLSVASIGKNIFGLFFPIFAARLAWVGMKTTDTALLGQSGTDFLSASSLADFWTGAFAPFMMDSVLSSKCGPAYGAKNYAMVSVWSQISMTLYSWAIIFVFAAFCATGPVMKAMGESEEIAGYAAYYAFVLGLCLPARLISGTISAFFYCQAKTRPSSVISVLALVLNLGFGLQFVLGIPLQSVPTYGFWACPVVTTCVEWTVTSLYVLVYCKYLRYHDECWTPEVAQWSFCRDVFLAPLFASEGSERFAYYNKWIRPNIGEYIRLALPANLAVASDFWRMSAIGILAGTLGTKEVAVFNASYRLAWMNMTVIGSFSSAACLQLGIALGTGDDKKSKKIVGFGVTVVMTFLLITTSLTVYYVKQLGSIFSSDSEVIDLFEECGFAMGFMIFFMCLAMHFELILLNLGKSITVFRAGLAGSWLGQVPGVVLMIKYSGNNLTSVYQGVGIGYSFYLLLVIVPFAAVDWKKEARAKFEESRKREPLLSK